MKIHIKQATIGDAETVAAISGKTFYDTFHEANTAENMQLYLAQHFNLEAITAALSKTTYTYLLAYTDDVLVGYAKLCESPVPAKLQLTQVIEIANLYATKESIGKGVGKALMQHCITIAVEQKKQAIWLGVWEHNPRAIAFYQQWGFEKFDEHKFILGYDIQNDWLMRKLLF